MSRVRRGKFEFQEERDLLRYSVCWLAGVVVVPVVCFATGRILLGATLTVMLGFGVWAALILVNSGRRRRRPRGATRRRANQPAGVD